MELYPKSKYFFFKPKNLGDEDQYSKGIPLNKIFINYASGISFRKDNLLVKKHFTKKSVEQMLSDIASLPDEDILKKYDFNETADWKLKDKRHLFLNWKPEDIVRVMYRALDFRYAFYPIAKANQIIVRGDSRIDLMKNVLLHKNVGLQFNRQIVGDSVSHFLASRVPTTGGTFYLGNKGKDYFAPLYLFSNEDRIGLLSDGSLRVNLSLEFLTAFANKLEIKLDSKGMPLGVTPLGIFHYAYAVFHSPSYRSRYFELLKLDFPRLPLTGNFDLFNKLSDLGNEITALHLFESPKIKIFSTHFNGLINHEIEKISWSNNTVWIDKLETIGFEGVVEEVWNFNIGGFQISEKWLKDRKGMKLTKQDIFDYQSLVMVLSESIHIMKEIDVVISQHGGWTEAF